MSIKSLPKPRVVVDTNVFVSAFVWDVIPQKVVAEWLEERFVVLLSPFLLSEILKTLKKFDYTEEDLRELRSLLENHTLQIIPPLKVSYCRDPKDNQILDLSLAGQASFLVTGDKDLLTLKSFRDTKILRPKDFLERVGKSQTDPL
ncbi:MAG: putative toxin-antitoxin system toxin component, PIN family [Patescibacteria group bacterium]